MPHPSRTGPTRRRGAAARPLATAIVLAAALAACSGADPSPAARRATAAGAQHSAAPARSTAPPAAPPPGGSPPGASSAGSSPTVIAVPPPAAGLHQTRAFPSAETTIFRAQMTDLWAAVVTGRPRLALQAFFPLAAYEQVKAIPAPAADWRHRLFGDFRLDVRAAHRFLGRRAGQAALVRVLVPQAQASWIGPGACYNSVGYWHVAGARVLYRLGRRLRSVGIASLISWRGRWYVVHFGAVLRAAAGGVVDSPAAGAGVPGPPGGC